MKSPSRPGYARATADGSELDVWVVPGSSRTEIAGLHGGAVRVRVAAPPEGGKANRAVENTLRRVIGASHVELSRGARSRRKVFALVGVSPAQVAARLGL